LVVLAPDELRIQLRKLARQDAALHRRNGA
jgi:hypothetical protein